MKQESKWIYRVTLTAVFAALVFVSSMISVPIPVAIGDVTRIHLGNIFCLLSGLVLGPVGGGLAAGLGSALYDMTNRRISLPRPLPLPLSLCWPLCAAG